MSDKPILFRAPMVRALLAGTKTQTRRTIKSARVFSTPEARAFTLVGDDLTRALQNASGFRRYDGNGWRWESDAFPWQAPAKRTGWLAHIGYAPGDRLYVREWIERAGYGGEAVGYPADGSWLPNTPWRWSRSGIASPRDLSRITLTVTDVRVQRLQDISEEDAIAEGCKAVRSGCFVFDATAYDRAGLCHSSAVMAYSVLWDEINGEGSWDANPWCAAYTFTVALGNIDQIARAA